MFDKVALKFMPFVDGVMAFFAFMQHNQIILALVAGMTLPFSMLLKRGEHQDAPIYLKLIIVFSFLCLIFGTLSPATTWALRFLYPGRDEITTPALLWGMLILFTVSGVILHLFLRRIITPELDKMKHKLIKKTSLERNTRTDVREIKSLLPSTESYDPMNFIDLSKGIFIGLDEQRQPQYIPVEAWQKQHADVIGTTGAGKGVASGLLLYQSILAGEGVFVMDPKNDEWAPHLFKKACLDAGKPFILIDLNKQQYQLDFLNGITGDHLEELLVAGFGLSEKGEAADFYRIDDRRAARYTGQLIETFPDGATIKDLFNSEYVSGIVETIKGFHGKLEELSLLKSINAKGGLRLQDIFDNGGCCYVIGSMRNSKVITSQRMILVRLLQLAELRDRVNTTPRPIAIFLDELKYHLSRPALEGLGAARDKGVHIIMAHQSIADLRDCPADLNGDSVVGAVVENAKFKLVYKLQDPDTADWVARMSGTILVDDESRKAKSTTVLTEIIDDERTIRQAERYYIDSNMLQNLPPFVSYIFTATTLPRASLISPVRVAKSDLELASFEGDDTRHKRNVIDFDEALPAADEQTFIPEASDADDFSQYTPEPEIELPPESEPELIDSENDVNDETADTDSISDSTPDTNTSSPINF
ncbi:TraM recognition domain-containing protein [Lelliottia sp. V89_10]|uniref:type IV secretory system conjugative DNA transfer family protein n=1 Tax=Lelliottia wanjuensis TaxID=3050585 RepID=UPI00249E1559|nr:MULTISPECIES: type IV secretion system DNA-binding domain-containing protein [unclassified Lelliottia]MDI3360331.1 TraM recognition domain-containing protein [Lelliottia sp. V89_13]MDK9549443.1 TraM recognition domain-containing protein [Lelliottia sp. V89_5]MDK9596142.1 TraM recognition domain-containing protein [Lelliottia sp. V89_10]